MLGRHGDSLFWLARYFERSENNARRMRAVLYYALTREDRGEEEWAHMVHSMGASLLFEETYDAYDISHVIDFLLRNRMYENSVLSLVTKARQNARSVRTALTQEVWQALNECWINCESTLKRPVKIHDLPTILEHIIKGSSVFRGALYGTMLHNDIFNFLRLGTFIERADNTARLIDAKYHRLLPTAAVIGGGGDQGQWEVMLQSLAAWKSFNWLKKGRLDPTGVADFLIFDVRMPRSMAFCYREVNANLADLSAAYGRSYTSKKMSDDVCDRIDVGRTNKTHAVNLRGFISECIALNNRLSLAIAEDFNMT